MSGDKRINLCIIDRMAGLHAPMLKAILSMEGYDANVESYENISAGIDRIECCERTIVLLGQRAACPEGYLQNGQGLANYSISDAVSRIKTRNPNAKVALFTSSGMSEEDAINAGADHYINKEIAFSRMDDGKHFILGQLECLIGKYSIN